MRDLLAPEASRRIEIKGRGTYSVPAPTTRQALTVILVYQREAGGDVPDDDRALLRKTCAEWLPVVVYSVLFSNQFSAQKRRMVLLGCVWAGIPEEVQERFEDAGEAGEEGAGESPKAAWRDQLLRYCRRLGTPWREALKVPFPSLVAQMTGLPMLRAQAKKDVADANILVRSEDGQGAYEDLAEKARGGLSKPEETPDTGAWSDDPEERKKWEARKMAELKEVKQNMKKRTPRDLNQ
jgi:hypothetical protein